jgi:CheY-like chemotaxis protein
VSTLAAVIDEPQVLVVDDNADKRFAIVAALAPLALPIVEADSGFAALRCLMEQDFAVILLDVRMPTMDGFETAGLIRQRQQSEMTPIIFLTAFDSDDIKSSDHYAGGAVDFLVAPLIPQSCVPRCRSLPIYSPEARRSQRARRRSRLLPTNCGFSPTWHLSASSRPTRRTSTPIPTRAGRR